MKKSVVFLSAVLIALLTVFCGLAFSLTIPTITFDDLTDTMQVTVENLDPTIFQQVQTDSGIHPSGDPYVSGGPPVEYGRVTFFVPDSVGATVNQYFSVVEPSQDPYNSGPSDLIYNIATPAQPAQQPLGTTWDIIYESDYNSVSPIPIPSSYFAGSVSEPRLGGNDLLEILGIPPPGGIGADITIQIISLDDIGSSEVPEPSTILLLAAGLAGVEILRRRFRNQQ
jgi:hypothetical protein